MLDAQSEIVLALGRDPVLAHRYLFPHRHSNATTPAHEDMIRWWHSREPYVLFEAFRGFAKSSIGEEAIIVKALYKRFRNGLVIGSNRDLAIERLQTIANELTGNDRITTVFGEQIGAEWAADKIVLANGVCIQAIGRGQRLRGTKYNDQRPDLFFGDDIEDDTDVATPEARRKVEAWFTRKLLPACSPPGTHIGRVAATRMDADALPARLERSGWIVRKYPILYLDAEGREQPTWPDRFPFYAVDEIRRGYERRGNYKDFLMEYQCIAERAEDKPFKIEQFRIEPHVRTWQAVYQMWDPARTVGQHSATTGYACWSWFGPKLIVWEGRAEQLMPDQIVKNIYDEAERYNPVLVGAEEDGLNEWLMQPLRQEAVRRGVSVPLKPVKAPKGKLDFIRGLQPFFGAREVEFARSLPDLEAQLLSFPTGKIDAPNALAYALRMRPGAPMYDDFGARNVTEEIRPAPGEPCWLCLNGTRGLVTGQLVQILDGAIRVYRDWVREGEPSQIVPDIVAAANLESGRAVRITCGAQHFDQFHNVGLVQAVRAMPAEVRRGVQPERGRPYIRQVMRREHRHMPMVLVSQEAHWTLNGFSAGYARALGKGGVVADFADEGLYRTLMEGLESFTGLLTLGGEGDDESGRFAYTNDGRRYRSAMATGR